LKILFIHRFYATPIVGGAEKSVRVLAEAMHNNGHEVVVLATSGDKGLRKEMIDGITVYYAGIVNSYWPYGDWSASKIRTAIWHMRDVYNRAMRVYVEEVLRKEQPDIVSCHNFKGWSISVWDAIRAANIPTVQVLHDFYFLCLRCSLFKDSRSKEGHPCEGRCLECRVMRLLHRYKSRQVDAVVGVSNHVLSRITDAGFFSNSLKTVIYNARAIPEVPKKERVKGAPLVFGFIGWLFGHKGIEWLLSEFKKIESCTVSLRIAGMGNSSYEERLKQLAGDDSRISFLGFSKPEDFYPSIDVLVVPSMWEEVLGMVAIEACAYHVPVITSGLGGLKEIIKDGYNGLYCDVNIPNTLSTVMQRLIDDGELFDRLRNNAQQSVRSFVDTDRLVVEYEAVYRKLISSYQKQVSV
jgi:glycosyltransferase involved in cell wall biosynthesis